MHPKGFDNLDFAPGSETGSRWARLLPLGRRQPVDFVLENRPEKGHHAPPVQPPQVTEGHFNLALGPWRNAR